MNDTKITKNQLIKDSIFFSNCTFENLDERMETLMGFFQRTMKIEEYGELFVPHWNPFHKYKNPRDKAKKLVREFIILQQKFGPDSFGARELYQGVNYVPDMYLDDPKLVAGMGILIGGISGEIFAHAFMADSDSDPKILVNLVLSKEKELEKSVKYFFGKGNILQIFLILSL